MSTYDTFAAYYDTLQQTDYKKVTDGLCEIFRRFSHKPHLLLDLACGTGGFSLEFAARGIDVIGVDASSEMLTAASEKTRARGLNALYLCQCMEELNLYGTVDTCVCMLDSLNHILDTDSLNTVFSRVSLFLEPRGLFLFDLNTPYKHFELLSDNTYVFEHPDLYCVWQNRNDSNITLITLDFFECQGEFYSRKTEQFYERAYSDDEIDKIINDNDFEVLAVYGDTPFSEPAFNTARKIYVTRKKQLTTDKKQ
ncbi:MAG TPA: class I SAM-dependent methyltransferase [Ruminococcaceae bacterium]|nr:class I SAM-dependent methyltransferase [Oscillospiraceae bacterium]